MKSGEDFRRAMGPADDGFVRVITQALSDLRMKRKQRGVRAAGKASASFAGNANMDKRLIQHG